MTAAIGERRIGLRATDRDVLNAIAHGLAAYLVAPSDEPTDTFYAVVSARCGRSAPLHQLHWENLAVTRTRDVDRLVATLASHLAGHAQAPTDGQCQVNGVAVVGGDGATVLPVGLWPALAVTERRMHAAGQRVVHAPRVALDGSNGAIVVNPGLAHVAPLTGRPWPGATPGCYPVRMWGVLSDRPVRQSQVVRDVTAAAVGAHVDPQRLLDAVTDAVRGTRIVSIAPAPLSELAQQLCTLLVEPA